MAKAALAPEVVPVGDGRVRQRSGSNKWFYYYPKCMNCGKSKGKSNQPYCMKCRFGPRKGLKVPCTHCGEVLDRDDLIISLYKVGVSVPELASIFNLSDTRIHQVIRWWSLGKKNPNRKPKV